MQRKKRRHPHKNVNKRINAVTAILPFRRNDKALFLRVRLFFVPLFPLKYCVCAFTAVAAAAILTVRYALALCHYCIYACMRYLSVWQFVILGQAMIIDISRHHRHTKWISWEKKNGKCPRKRVSLPCSICVCVALWITNRVVVVFFFLVLIHRRYPISSFRTKARCIFFVASYFNFVSQSSVCRLSVFVYVCICVCMLIITISYTILPGSTLVCICKYSVFSRSCVCMRVECCTFISWRSLWHLHAVALFIALSPAWHTVNNTTSTTNRTKRKNYIAEAAVIENAFVPNWNPTRDVVYMQFPRIPYTLYMKAYTYRARLPHSKPWIIDRFENLYRVQSAFCCCFRLFRIRINSGFSAAALSATILVIWDLYRETSDFVDILGAGVFFYIQRRWIRDSFLCYWFTLLQLYGI